MAPPPSPLLSAARRLAVSAAICLTVCASPPAVRSEIRAESQMLLGNPDNAAADAKNREHYLIRRPQYALSYSDRLRFPNWVAWHLNAGDVGTVARGQFVPDTTLPSGFTQVTPSDYTRSGYDRGHNCPSADRSASPGDNDAVFLMTNMTPQAHGMNAGPWEKLEMYCRDQAKRGSELYIVCGHGFSAPTHNTIGRNKVAVPDFGWKVVVVLPDQPGDDLKRINSGTRVIAVRMPNVNTVSREEWTRYLTTPAEIEKATSVKLFTALPPAVANALRSKQDAGGGTATRATRTRSRNGTRSSTARPTRTRKSAGAKQVWVNTRSGAYWQPGTQYSGKTKEGKYMTEAEALKAGYHAAGGPK